MSKTASKNLFELIKSMSKSEKRYFKVLSSRHTIGEENNYIRLFDFIEAMDEYEESNVFSHFEGEAFLNKFSITKNRLYESIIKSLVAFHSNSSVDAQIYRFLHASEVLYKKSLYDHASKQLRSAERLARKNDRLNLLLEIEKQKKKIIETQGYAKISVQEIDLMISENHSISAETDLNNMLWGIKSKLFIMINGRGKVRCQSDVSKFKKLKNELDQLKIPTKISFDNQYLYNHLLSAYYFAVLDKEESLAYLYLNFELLKSKPSKIKEEPNIYASVLSNIIHLESHLNNYKSTIKLLNELKTFTAKYKIKSTEDLDIKIFSSVYSTELMLLINQGEFDKAVNLTGVIEEGLRLHNNSITPSRRAYLSFKIAIAYFGVNDLNKSLEWLNKILNDQELDETEDIYSFAQIVNLLVHFELNNDRLLPYAIKNTQRFLKKRNRTYHFETVFLKSLSKICKSSDRFEQEDILEDIVDDLNKIKTDPFESVALEYFNFHNWATAKLKGVPLKEVQRTVYLSSLK